jgi:Ca2+-binding EF-hand superfamily protein
MFQRFDTDGTGTLDIGELQKLLQKSPFVFNKETTEGIFKILDADGSGGLTVEEFQRLV